MKEICDYQFCYGCEACKNICPKKAISFFPDKYGFLMPLIDTEKCVNCNLCTKVCPVNNDIKSENIKLAFAFKANKRIRIHSQSGGAFTVFAEKMLEMKYIIYGVAIQNTTVFYKRIDSLTDLDSIKKSKYVKAKVGDTFRSIEKDLLDGQYVCFSGTPCMVEPLIMYLNTKKIPSDRLLTIDILCYGAPSHELFDDYIKLIEKKFNKQVDSFVFRDKRWSLNQKFSKISWKGENYNTITNSYLKMFSSKLAIRSSCQYCKYSNPYRRSDITIGDCWGIEKLKPLFYDPDGISLVIINSKKGQEAFDLIKASVKTKKIKFSDCQKYQTTLSKPCGIVINRDNFLNETVNNGLRFSLNKYTNFSDCLFVNESNGKLLNKCKIIELEQKKKKIKKYFPFSKLIYLLKK